ncbi:hypothetical protein N7451_012700 [Penicillium sp. IBT 35674x]|nr:hypothetical protein N7451_012700 [Penicillium sp. IBT 35674x]
MDFVDSSSSVCGPRYWNAIDALQNRRLASFLPGPGLIQENWAEQYGPLKTLGHDVLPGFSASGNPPRNKQREPGAKSFF